MSVALLAIPVVTVFEFFFPGGFNAYINSFYIESSTDTRVQTPLINKLRSFNAGNALFH